jgi:hypothetical protein
VAVSKGELETKFLKFTSKEERDFTVNKEPKSIVH